MKNDNEVVILEPHDYVDPSDKKFGKIYTYYDLKFFSRIINLSKDFNFKLLIKIWAIIKGDKPDIILTTHPSGIIAFKIISIIARKKISIVYDAHNVESDFVKEILTNNDGYSRLEQFIIPLYVSILENIGCKFLVNQITTVSGKDRNRFIKKYKLDPKKVVVVPSGCNIKNGNKMDKKYLKKQWHRFRAFNVVIFHGLYSIHQIKMQWK